MKTLPTRTIGIGLVLTAALGHGQQASGPSAPACAASCAPSALSAPASAPTAGRGGSPTPYQPPIAVPSAAGQIPRSSPGAAAITIAPAGSPTFTGNCDSSGCWGSDGRRYNAVGGALVGPDGRSCQSVGGVLQCQ